MTQLIGFITVPCLALVGIILLTSREGCLRFWGATVFASGVLYLWLAVPVKTHGALPWEQQLATQVAGWHGLWPDSLLVAMAWIGQSTVVVPATVAAAFVNRRRWVDFAWFCAFIVAASPLIGEVLRWWVGRSHPSGAGTGFPSDHTLLATIVVGLSVVVMWAPVTSTLVRAGVLLLGAIVVFVVAVSRVYFDLDWPADVIGAWSLASRISAPVCGSWVESGQRLGMGTVDVLAPTTARTRVLA